MKSSFLLVLFCTGALVSSKMVRANEPTQQIVRAGTQSSVIGSSQLFTGSVRIDPVFPGTDKINASAVITISLATYGLVLASLQVFSEHVSADVAGRTRAAITQHFKQ